MAVRVAISGHCLARPVVSATKRQQESSASNSLQAERDRNQHSFLQRPVDICPLFGGQLGPTGWPNKAHKLATAKCCRRARAQFGQRSPTAAGPHSIVAAQADLGSVSSCFRDRLRVSKRETEKERERFSLSICRLQVQSRSSFARFK